MKEPEMKIIANIFKEAIINKDDEGKLKKLKSEVLDLCN